MARLSVSLSHGYSKLILLLLASTLIALRLMKSPRKLTPAEAVSDRAMGAGQRGAVPPLPRPARATEAHTSPSLFAHGRLRCVALSLMVRPPFFPLPLQS